MNIEPYKNSTILLKISSSHKFIKMQPEITRQIYANVSSSKKLPLTLDFNCFWTARKCAPSTKNMTFGETFLDRK